jgi:CheY-like chemotaxis protein
VDRMGSPHILIINTDPSVLLVVHDLVKEAGYAVSLLSYHNHDLDEIKRLSPDLIVLDYKWSGDDNGWSLLQLLRLDPETVSIPIVLCTGAAREVDALHDHLAAIGVRGVVKPFLAETLLTAITGATADMRSALPRPTSEQAAGSRRPSADWTV